MGRPSAEHQGNCEAVPHHPPHQRSETGARPQPGQSGLWSGDTSGTVRVRKDQEAGLRESREKVLQVVNSGGHFSGMNNIVLDLPCDSALLSGTGRTAV